MRKSLAVLALLMGSLFTLGGLASADPPPPNPGVCTGTHIDPPDDTTTSLTVTAPEGQLISGYCVKAGSINQGLGPEYVTVDPPAASVTISHTSGKDISHYSLTFVTVSTTDGTTDDGTDTDTDGSTDLGTDTDGTTDGGTTDDVASTDTVGTDGADGTSDAPVTASRNGTATAADVLPVTGSNDGWLLLVGLGFIVIGLVLIAKGGSLRR